eukprot:4081542-Amphidinium_carterae.1
MVQASGVLPTQDFPTTIVDDCLHFCKHGSTTSFNTQFWKSFRVNGYASHTLARFTAVLLL